MQKLPRVEIGVAGEEIADRTGAEKPGAAMLGGCRQGVDWRLRPARPRNHAVRLVLAAVVVARIGRDSVGKRERKDVRLADRLDGGDLGVRETGLAIVSVRASQFVRVKDGSAA